MIEQLGRAGLGEGARVIMEKPFGRDLASARELDALVHSVFDEEQVFRIDHYIGREAVQNLLAMRFANGMFEPVWNRNHIDHVQIDVPETLSIEMRGGFYEETGAFRDMIVTHLFQVLSFVAMEPPVSLNAKSLMTEREKVFEAMKTLEPGDVVRGQYAGYREEEGVAADSDTETFVALRAFVDNWRWEGVPFFLRSGKRLADTHHLLTVAFSEPPRRMFPIDCSAGRRGVRPRPPHLRARRPRLDLRLLPGQGAGAEDAARPGPHALQLRRQLRRARAGARRLRAPDLRCHGRRPDPLHHLGGDRAPLGNCRPGGSRTAARSRSTSRARGGRRRPTPCLHRTAGMSRATIPERGRTALSRWCWGPARGCSSASAVSASA